MGETKKLCNDEIEKNNSRDKLEKLILTYLDAARYLATCGEFNEEKFDRIEQIKSKHEWYRPRPESIQEIKASVPKLIFTDTGLIGWNHLKVREMQSLSEAIDTFIQTLLKDFPDDRTENFAKRAISEMEQISKLINALKAQYKLQKIKEKSD